MLNPNQIHMRKFVFFCLLTLFALGYQATAGPNLQPDTQNSQHATLNPELVTCSLSVVEANPVMAICNMDITSILLVNFDNCIAKPETRISKPETLNPELATRNPNLATSNAQLATRNKEPITRNKEPITSNQEPEPSIQDKTLITLQKRHGNLLALRFY